MTDEAESDRLYALPLEEFTAARDALAGRLRSAGDAAAAAAVKSAKKATTPAWAVNQLARRQRPLVEDLIDSVDRLRRAQQDLVSSGGSAQTVWEATLQERDIVSRLAHEAERILEGQGYGATRATLDRITDTLTAAAADARSRDLLRRGVLTQEMRRAGFGGLLESDAPAEAAPRVAATKKTKPARAARAAKPAPKEERAGGPTPRAVLEAEREAVRARRTAERAEDDAVRLEREAARAARELDAASKRLNSAERDAAKTKAAATEARKEAKSAERVAERAGSKLEKLRKSRKR